VDITQATIDRESGVAERPFTFRQRVLLVLIHWVGVLAIRLVGMTLRFTASSEEDGIADPAALPQPGTIAPFWHRCVFPATYFFRNRGISVMTSRSFDGEYIARIIESFGFKAVRGSSSRGAVRALLGMHSVIDAQGVAAFTIDGPRGPVYVAKPGPTLLARNTGQPIRCFYIALQDAWVLNSWDRFLIPKPFAKAHVRWSAPITVPRGTSSEALGRYHQQMQDALERVRAAAESVVGAST
jgi:lysophospholipid acyltransferase (LPLAT)-like uncharacterized protein